MENLNNWDKFQKWALAHYKTYKFLIQHGDNYEEAYKNIEGLVSKKEFAKIYKDAQKMVSYFSEHQKENTAFQQSFGFSFFKRS